MPRKSPNSNEVHLARTDAFFFAGLIKPVAKDQIKQLAMLRSDNLTHVPLTGQVNNDGSQTIVWAEGEFGTNSGNRSDGFKKHIQTWSAQCLDDATLHEEVVYQHWLQAQVEGAESELKYEKGRLPDGHEDKKITPTQIAKKLGHISIIGEMAEVAQVQR